MNSYEKYLLREYYPLFYDRQVVIENEKHNKETFYVGILQKCNVLNRNNRIYPLEVMQKAVESYYKLVEEGLAAGELDHPEIGPSKINMQHIAIRITDIWWQEDELWGKMLIAHTPAGDILRGLMKTGFKIGISSRGVGSVKKNKDGIDVVQDDFVLISFDVVIRPSTPGAYINNTQVSLKEWHKIPISHKEYEEVVCTKNGCYLL